MVNGFRTRNWSWLAVLALAAPFAIHHSPFTTAHAAPDIEPASPIDTEVLVRVVGHGSMVLGDDVGGARVTITDIETGQILASGLQRGESGDQNQIMRTPRIMEEPQYSTRPSASFHATLQLRKPTVVEIAALGPLAYPQATRRISTTVLLLPGRDVTGDGIVLPLYGFIVQIEQPKPGDIQMAKRDVTLQASVRTMSGALVRPHGDWDSRKIEIAGEVIAGDRVIERLQFFYAGKSALFEAPFTVPALRDAPNGVTVRVIAVDRSRGHFGIGTAEFPVVAEQFKPAPKKER